VHVHAADQLLDIVSAISRLTRAKLFMTTHGLFFHTETLALVKKIYLRTITRWSLSRAQAIFAVSRNDATTLQKVGIESILLRNPVVPLGDFICEGEDLLYVGRLSDNKRIGALIEFMAHLVPVNPSISLHIVGQDNERLWPALSGAVARQNLQSNVIYHGYLDAAALADVAKTCGFTVSASRYEGYGLSVVEGMSVGLLPCMHANSAFEETYRLSGCGLLTNFDDPSCAARAFLDWYPQVERNDREKAVRFARAQSWESVVPAYERHYLADRPAGL
jgi:alpha-1,3-mannosyltransferase